MTALARAPPADVPTLISWRMASLASGPSTLPSMCAAGSHDEIGQPDRRDVGLRDLGGRRERQRTHRAVGRVGEAIEGGDVGGGDAVFGHPGVDQCVAESVGQAVSDERREPVVRRRIELIEHEDPGTIRAPERCEFDATRDPVGEVLECVCPSGIVVGDRPDRPPPGRDFDDVNRGVRHCSVPARTGAPPGLLLARLRGPQFGER